MAIVTHCQGSTDTLLPSLAPLPPSHFTLHSTSPHCSPAARGVPRGPPPGAPSGPPPGAPSGPPPGGKVLRRHAAAQWDAPRARALTHPSLAFAHVGGARACVRACACVYHLFHRLSRLLEGPNVAVASRFLVCIPWAPATRRSDGQVYLRVRDRRHGAQCVFRAHATPLCRHCQCGPEQHTVLPVHGLSLFSIGGRSSVYSAAMPTSSRTIHAGAGRDFCAS